MESYQVTLPFPPSLNGLYPGKARRFKSKRYKQWLIDCPTLEPRRYDLVRITYKIYYPDKKVRDSKNFLKAVDDYLVAQDVIVDDNWMVLAREIIEPCGIDRGNPRIEIIIQPRL